MNDPDVKDTDKGFNKMLAAFAAADGCTAFVGILSGKPAYPPQGKQTKGNPWTG